jgi:hypothetical protein
LGKLLRGVGNVLTFAVHHKLDRGQRRKTVGFSEAAYIRSNGAARKNRNRKTGEYSRLQPGDAVAHRAYRPLLACGAQRLKGVMAVNTSLRKDRQGKGLSQFRAASDGGDPHQRLAANEFTTPEFRLVGHERDIDLISFQRRMKMDAAGAAQLDFHIRVGTREILKHFRQNIWRVEIRCSQRNVTGDVGSCETAARFVVQSQHRPRKFKQDLPVMSQAELAAILIEQGAADRVFQAPDLMRNRRLGTAHLPAGGRKSSRIDDRDERSEQRDIEIMVQ